MQLLHDYKHLPARAAQQADRHYADLLWFFLLVLIMAVVLLVALFSEHRYAIVTWIALSTLAVGGLWIVAVRAPVQS